MKAFVRALPSLLPPADLVLPGVALPLMAGWSASHRLCQSQCRLLLETVTHCLFLIFPLSQTLIGLLHLWTMLSTVFILSRSILWLTALLQLLTGSSGSS